MAGRLFANFALMMLRGSFHSFRPKYLREFIAHRWQRARRGFSVYDTFSFDEYLSFVIAEGVKEIKARGIGAPSDLTENEWNDILSRISNGFMTYYTDGFTEYNSEGFIEAKKLFVKYFHSLWD